MAQTATVKYQIATYSGEVEVHGIDENDDNDHIIARAKAQLRRQSGGCSLPMAYESWKITDRREQ